MPSLPKIKVQGDFFLNEDNSESHYVGYSDFGLWKRFNMQDGPEALVRPLLQERRGLAEAAGYSGPLTARVFRYADPGNAFGMLPDQADFSKINAFLDMAAEYKVYIDWTCGDSQKPYMLPNVADQQLYINTFCSKIERVCFFETCNQPFKNGNLPKNGVVPPISPWYLRDSGDYGDIGSGDGWPFHTSLDFISYHGTRDHNPGIRFPKWVMDLDDQIGTLRTHVGKPPVLKEPNGFSKHFASQARYNDPYLAKLLGHRIAMGGVCFHSQLGLESNGFDAEHKEAFSNYCAGVAGALR